MTHLGLLLLHLLRASHGHMAPTWGPSAIGMNLPKGRDTVTLNSTHGLSFPFFPLWVSRDQEHQRQVILNICSEI